MLFFAHHFFASNFVLYQQAFIHSSYSKHKYAESVLQAVSTTNKVVVVSVAVSGFTLFLLFASAATIFCEYKKFRAAIIFYMLTLNLLLLFDYTVNWMTFEVKQSLPLTIDAQQILFSQPKIRLSVHLSGFHSCVPAYPETYFAANCCY